MNLRRSAMAILACIAVLAILLPNESRPASGQEGAKESVPAKKAGAKKFRRRLPNFYGQIGLSNDQKTKIYDIQKKYFDQIQELEKQLAALREKQKQDVDAVLTAEQKKELAKLVEESSKRKRSRSKKKETS